MRRRRRARRRAVMVLVLAVLIVAVTGLVSSAVGRPQASQDFTTTQAEAEREEDPVVILETSPEPVHTEPPKKFQEIHSMDWGADDAYLMAKLAMAEAEGESTEGKAMVMMVVLNRVFDPDFPGTISEVVYERRQFSPVWEDDWEDTEPDADCWAALELIESGWDESEGATYFEATYNGEDTWHSRNLEYIKTVGGHNFYREAEE